MLTNFRNLKRKILHIYTESTIDLKYITTIIFGKIRPDIIYFRPGIFTKMITTYRENKDHWLVKG